MDAHVQLGGIILWLRANGTDMGELWVQYGVVVVDAMEMVY